MGVGETVNMDDKGRIVVPAEIRRVIGKRVFSVEIADKDTIILRAERDPHDHVKRIESLRLTGDGDRAFVDVATVKDLYGGKRVETT